MSMAYGVGNSLNCTYFLMIFSSVKENASSASLSRASESTSWPKAGAENSISAMISLKSFLILLLFSDNVSKTIKYRRNFNKYRRDFCEYRRDFNEYRRNFNFVPYLSDT